MLTSYLCATCPDLHAASGKQNPEEVRPPRCSLHLPVDRSDSPRASLTHCSLTSDPPQHAGASHPPFLFNGPQARANQAATVLALRAIVRATHKIENVVGLELLNEPQPNPALIGWQKDTMKKLREEMGGGGDYAL